MEQSLVDKVYEWIGEENVRYFKHLKGLTGTVSPVLKLNMKRKFIPAHPVHLREGMQIRNFMRRQPECENWGDHEFDENWIKVIESCIKKYEDGRKN